MASRSRLFTMSGIEGHIFGPMAKTYGYAIAGGLIATFTISPALSALLLPDSVAETETLLVRRLRRGFWAGGGVGPGHRTVQPGRPWGLVRLVGGAAGVLGVEV